MLVGKLLVLTVAYPYPPRLLSAIIAAIFAKRIYQRQRLDAREVSSHSVDQIAAKIATVNFLDGIELLDKVFDLHCVQYGYLIDVGKLFVTPSSDIGRTR